MSSLTRSALFVAALLAVCVFAGFVLHRWLERQTAALIADATAAHRHRLDAALTLAAPDLTDAAQRATLGAALGADVQLASSAPPARSGTLAFEYAPPHGNPALRVSFAKPAAVRVLSLSAWTLGVALFVVVAGLPTAFLLGAARATRATAPDNTIEETSLARLAQTTVAQTAALDRERLVRRRAEEDAQLKQQLLTQSLQDKIRLGHDLHDGIIQSLYAVGLTLESTRTLLPSNPAEADRRLEQCRDALNGTIREVRAYITGLAPQNLSSATFRRTLDELLTPLTHGRDVALAFEIDDTASARLSSEQATEVVQFAREAVSNAARHAAAARIAVSARSTADVFTFSIADNGRGFAPATARGTGFGLSTLDARAQRLGGRCTIDSERGVGTRVVLEFPFASAA
jgi:signal transduction histidine kinase